LPRSAGQTHQAQHNASAPWLLNTVFHVSSFIRRLPKQQGCQPDPAPDKQAKCPDFIGVFGGRIIFPGCRNCCKLRSEAILSQRYSSADVSPNAARIWAAGNSGKTRFCSCPGGSNDNSPAFQRWVCTPAVISPEGTSEAAVRRRPFGTWPPLTTVPALKRWAILAHPYGMMTIKSYWHWASRLRYYLFPDPAAR